MKNDSPRRSIRPVDFLILGLLVAACLLLYFLLRPKTEGAYAVLYRENTEIARFALNEDLEYTVPDCPDVTLQIKDGAIRFLESDCPDKVCVNSGFLSHPGEYAVCLPNKLSLKVIGQSTDGPDAIAGGH